MRARLKLAHFAWAMWTIAILFVFGSMLLRVYPSVMVKSLMSSFHLSAETVGFIDSLYFYVLAIMQIPAGLLMDRYGPGRTLFWAFAISGIAAILYGLAPHPWILGSARVLAGFGTSFFMVGLVYITSRLFPRRMFTLLMGIAKAVGMLGAICAQGPIAMLDKDFYWRSVSITLGIIGIILSIVTIFIYIRRPKDCSALDERPPASEVFHHFKQLIAKPQTWILSFTNLFLFSFMVGFAAFWGTQFLQSVTGLAKIEADFVVSTTFLGMLIGAIIIGKLTMNSHHLKTYVCVGILLCLACTIPVLYAPLSIPWMIVFLFLFGLFFSVQIPLYPLLVFPNPKNASATAMGIFNTIAFSSGFIFQFLVGFILEQLGEKVSTNTHLSASPEHWKIAMTIFPIALGIAFLLSLLIKNYKPSTQNHH